MKAGKLIIGAMLVAMLVLAYAPALPANAQSQYVEVLTQVVTENNVIYFEANLTALRNSLGWVGSEILIYVSNNGLSTITNNESVDYKVVGPIYVATESYVAGTIVINSTIVNKLLGGNSGYLYIKITDGSNIVASNRFYVVTNVSDVIKVTPDSHNLSFVNNTLVDSYNTFTYKLDTTSLGLTVNLSASNVTVKFIAGTSTLEAFNYTYNSSLTVQQNLDNATSQIFNLTYKFINETVVAFNGTLEEFPLPVLNAVATVLGKPVNFTEFKFTMEASSGTISLSNVHVITNSQDVGHSDTYSLENVTVNIGSINATINIFPSIEITGTNTTLAGTPTDLNPGDNLTITVHQFPNSGSPLTVCLFNANTGAKVASIATTVTVSNYGNATFNVTLPEKPYGGQPLFVMVKEGTNIRGLPTDTNITVKPYIDVAFVKNDGTFAQFNTVNVTAPGDYVLIKGYGFLPNDNVTVSTYYNGQYVDNLLVLLDIDGDQNLTVQQNGTFFALFRIPTNADTSISNFTIVAHGDTTGDSGTSLITFNYTFGSATAKVFVNPQAEWVNTTVWNESSAKVVQTPVSEGYPYEVPWQTGGTREFTVELIGMNFTQGVIALNQTAAGPFFNATSVTISEGYFNGTVEIPVAPYGNFYVTAMNASNTNANFTTYQAMITIKNTARAIDPVALQLNGTINYTLIVYLGSPENFTVLGYGWPAGDTINATITKEGSAATETIIVTTVATNGTFNATVAIADFLNQTGNGTYTVTLYDANNSAVPKVNITVYYSITPTVTIKIYTGTLKLTYPGDTVDVFTLVYLGGSPADGDQLYSSKVLVTVYYYNGTQLVTLVDNGEAHYTGVPGIWHYRFHVPVTVKGDDLLIKVTATVRPKFYMLPQTDTDYASLTVAGSLEDLLAKIEDMGNSLTANMTEVQATLQHILSALAGINMTLVDINGQLVAVEQAVNNAASQISSQIGSSTAQIENDMANMGAQIMISLAQLQALLAMANANITLVVANTQAIQSELANATASVNEQLGNILLEIEAYGDQINMTLGTVLDKLDAIITSVNNGMVTISTLIGNVTTNVTTLINGLNATITGLITAKSGEIMVLINTTAGNMMATIDAAKKLILENISMNAEDIMEMLENMNATMAAKAMEVMNELGMLNTTIADKAEMISNDINAAANKVNLALGTVENKILGEINNRSMKVMTSLENTMNLINNSTSQVVSLVKTVNQNVATVKTGVDQANTGIKNINSKLDALQTALTSKIDNLQSTIQNSNNQVKSRVTALGGISTIILLAAIFGVAAMSRKG